MSEIPLILGVGLGGIGLGTIIAAGYLYSKKDREEIIDFAEEKLPSIPFQNIPDEELTPEQIKEQKKIKALRKETILSNITKRQRKIEEKQMKVFESEQKKEAPKIKQLEQLYKDIKKLDEELQPINDKLDSPSISQQNKKDLERRRSEILAEARSLEKQIKNYPQHLRQMAKYKLAIERDKIASETNGKPSEIVVEESISKEGYDSNDENITPEDDNTPEDDYIMSMETTSDRDSFSSNPAGGSKYFTLTYTPKKITKKYKTNINKKKSKHNRKNNRKIKT